MWDPLTDGIVQSRGYSPADAQIINNIRAPVGAHHVNANDRQRIKAEFARAAAVKAAADTADRPVSAVP